MDFLDIAKTVGAGLFSALVPGGSVILGEINKMLPDNKKLPKSATGSDIINAVDNLSPELQAEISLRQFDVDIEQIKQSHETVRAMLASDAITPQSTRPKIAYGSFLVVGISILITVLTWSYAVLSDNSTMVKAVMGGWGFLLAVITPLVILLHAYFGVIRSENQSKVNASIGKDTQKGIIGAIGALMGKRK